MNLQAVKQSYLTLQRYAGWLDRGRASAAVRADVASLGTAIDTGAETSSLLSGLDTSIARVPTAAMRKILRTTAGEIRRALEDQASPEHEDTSGRAGN
jgi:hypothetical protein